MERKEEQAYKNTDKTLWQKEDVGRVFITEQDGLGIEVGGYVIVRPLEKWHAEAEFMEKVSGGVEKKQGITFHSGRQNSDLSAYSPTDNYKIGFNEAIDLCNAHWAGKMKGIEEVLIRNCLPLEDYFRKNLTQALTNYLTKGL